MAKTIIRKFKDDEMTIMAPYRAYMQVWEYEKGIVKARFPGFTGYALPKWIELACGCFSEGSNFEAMLQKMFGTSQKLQGILLQYNGGTPILIKKDSDPAECLRFWELLEEEKQEKERRKAQKFQKFKAALRRKISQRSGLNNGSLVTDNVGLK